MPPSLKAVAYEWMESYHPEYVTIMARFGLKDKILSSYLFSNSMLALSAQKWWIIAANDAKNVGDQKLYDACVFFSKLHCLPASSSDGISTI